MRNPANMHLWIVFLATLSVGIVIAFGLHDLYHQIAHVLDSQLGSRGGS